MKQYVIIARDGIDEAALERRMSVRHLHLAGASVLKAQGQFVVGGATLDSEGHMNGSVMIVQFETEEAFDAWYRQEPYIVNGVWQHVEVLPFKVAPVE
ncbi:MAG: YciI family protein [Chitinophagaceae bacterium]|jgi:hypothetical protein|nr:YciI family protein [Chitinophagaceae bacterium]